jgi:predicted dehydrogenase
MRNFSDNDGSRLAWIVDSNDSLLQRFGRRYPNASLATNLAEALADPSLSAVSIATPVATHYPLARKCLEAGKSVLIEKPMAETAAQCDELIALARGNNLTLMVDHTFIYTGAVAAIKNLIESGELGEIYYFDSVRVNLGLFQHDVNVIWDLAPHDLSIMDFVLGKPPRQVSAHGACHIAGSSIENIAYLTLRFDDATIAHFHVNWLAPAKIRRIIIGGSKKMLVFDDLSPDEKIKIYDKGVVLAGGDKDATMKALTGYRVGDIQVPKIDNTEALRRVTADFIECITQRRQPLSNGDAGRRVVKILAAAQESLARDGAFIDL